jgi:type I restriction enzyme S subunit
MNIYLSSRLYNDDLRRIKISYPKSKENQRVIVQKINELSEKIKRLESIYHQKLNDLEELKKSILQKAFNGELKTSKISA